VNKGGDLGSWIFAFLIRRPFKRPQGFLHPPQLDWIDKPAQCPAPGQPPDRGAGLIRLRTVAMRLIRELRSNHFQGVGFLKLTVAARASLQRLLDPISYAPWVFDCGAMSAPLHATIFLMFASKPRPPSFNLLKGGRPNRWAASTDPGLKSRPAVPACICAIASKEVQLPPGRAPTLTEVSALTLGTARTGSG